MAKPFQSHRKSPKSLALARQCQFLGKQKKLDKNLEWATSSKIWEI